MNLVEKVAGTIKQNGLLKKGDSVLAALSGGPDSVALLHALVELRSTLKLKLHAVYINHQIRPAAAKKEEKFCRNLCTNWGVEFESVTANIPKLAKTMRKGIEETARDFRYEQFVNIGNKLNCRKIALGHHVDDRIETVLFRILRGTGRTGLVGIPIKRGKFIRPLFDVTKEEILEYLDKNKIKFCVDQSNAKSEYTRNFIRNRLLPLIRKRINKNVDDAILNLVDTIGDEEIFLEEQIDKAFSACISCTAGGKFVLATKRFNDYDLWVQRRLIRRCLVKASGSKNFPDKETVDRILNIVNGKGKALSIPENMQCERINDEVFIYKKGKRDFSRKLSVNGIAEIESDGILTLTEAAAGAKPVFQRDRKASKVIVDFDKLKLPLLVRNIKNGDRFQPLGLKGTKKIRDYLTDRKVMAILRDEIPVVTDSKGIVWLVGFEIDERVKIDQNTQRVLKIEYATGN